MPSRVAGQLLYHDVFPHTCATSFKINLSTEGCYPGYHDYFKFTAKEVHNRPSSPINGKATTAGSSLVFEDNVGEYGLSSQSTYKVNIDCPYYKASIAPNPKVLNDLKPSKKQLEIVYGGIMKEVNDLRLQIDSNKTLSCIDPQGKSFNTNIAKVKAKNVGF